MPHIMLGFQNWVDILPDQLKLFEGIFTFLLFSCKLNVFKSDCTGWYVLLVSGSNAILLSSVV